MGYSLPRSCSRAWCCCQTASAFHANTAPRRGPSWPCVGLTPSRGASRADPVRCGRTHQAQAQRRQLGSGHERGGRSVPPPLHASTGPSPPHGEAENDSSLVMELGGVGLAPLPVLASLCGDSPPVSWRREQRGQGCRGGLGLDPDPEQGAGAEWCQGTSEELCRPQCLRPRCNTLLPRHNGEGSMDRPATTVVALPHLVGMDSRAAGREQGQRLGCWLEEDAVHTPEAARGSFCLAWATALWASHSGPATAGICLCPVWLLGVEMEACGAQGP